MVNLFIFMANGISKENSFKKEVSILANRCFYPPWQEGYSRAQKLTKLWWGEGKENGTVGGEVGVGKKARRRNTYDSLCLPSSLLFHPAYDIQKEPPGLANLPGNSLVGTHTHYSYLMCFPGPSS